MRVLGIDFGHVRIGLSVSDPLRTIASPLGVAKGSRNPSIAAKNLAKELSTLLKAKEYEIDLIVVGLPLQLSGKESTRSQEAQVFAQILEQEMGISVVLFDERLTSVQAERSLKEAEFSRKKRKGFVDTVASTILLQSFLDSR